MAQVTIAEDDYGFNLDFTLQSANGDAFDGTGYTATLKVWNTLVPATLLLSKACTWDVAASGTCHYAVAPTDFATSGRYTGEVELTKTGSKVSFGPFTITVTESG